MTMRPQAHPNEVTHAAPSLGTALVCALALVGFAGNSLLARLALGNAAIDAASYTLVRLASGAAMLVAIAVARRTSPTGAQNWAAAASLAAYAAAFSFSYVRIGAALGALVLFPTVKLALLAHGFTRGERPRRLEWIGASLALAGLLVLTRPGAGRPDLLGVALMVAAGVAWAVYTVAGQRSTEPMQATTGNFVLSVAVALPLAWPAIAWGRVSAEGLLLAVVSGAITSALAYALWYRVVPRLTAMQMGLAQLSVPVLAGLGAVLLLDEALTGRLIAGGTLIVGGVIVALAWQVRRLR